MIISYYTLNYPCSDLLSAQSEFLKSASMTSTSCRLFNNHINDTRGQGNQCMISKGNHVKFACFVLFAFQRGSKDMNFIFLFNV